ncbi:MAG: glycosyltransferase [Bacteroidia bacterium]|nr:glycosyltransferase [Bacteroidia bacterium]
MKRKIILLGTIWPFRSGGIATFNERVTRALIDNGDEVINYTFSLQYPSFLFPGKTQLSDQPSPEGLDIRIKVNSINPFNWLKVGQEIKRLKPDLLLVRYWTPFMAPCLGTIAKIVRKNNHTKVIAIADNVIPHEKHFIDNILTRYFTNHCDGFITMSRAVLNDLKQFRPLAPMVYTPHPLYDIFGNIVPREQALKQLNLNPDFRYLLFFGFIRDYKGLDWLLEAFGDEKLRQFPVKLIIAGEFYTSPEKYLKIIREKNLTDHVILRTDFIADQEVANYFGAADMVVQPYKSATQSGVTQIAFHYNKPMLVTDVGGLGEIIPHGKVGYVINPGPEAITEAIFDFYYNDRSDFFTSNVISEKEKFSWGTMVETIEIVFDNINKL